MVNGRRTHLGTFDTAEKAARVYARAYLRDHTHQPREQQQAMQQQQQAPAMQVMQQHAARGMQRQAMQVTHHGGLAAPVDNVVMKTKLTPDLVSFICLETSQKRPKDDDANPTDRIG